MQKHEWKEETPDGRRFYRVLLHGNTIALRTQLRGEDFWEDCNLEDKELLEKTRDILWKKYQRGRCAHKYIVAIDKRIDAL